MNNKKPWIIVAVGCGMIAGSVGLSINASGVFYAAVTQDLGIGRGAFAMHMTIFTLMTALGAFVVPSLINRVKYKALLIGAVVVAAVSTFLMGRVSSLPLFYILGAIRGISTCMFSVVPVTMIINNWFVKNHGTATSIVLSSSGIAGALGSPIISSIIAAVGWRNAYTILGILIAVLALPAILFPFEVNPADEGKLPFGGTQTSNLNKLSEKKKEKQAFNFIQFPFIALCLMGIMIAFVTSIAQHYPGFAESIGYGAVGALMLSVAMIGNIVSKLLIGILADLIGAVKATLVMIASCVVGMLIILFAFNSWMLLIGSFLFGGSYSVAAVSLALLTRNFFDVELYNTVYPPINAACNAGSAVSLTAIGVVYDVFQSYRIAIIICIILAIFAFVLVFINEIRRSRESY